MAQLIGKEPSGGRTDYWWKHWGNNGKEVITLQTVEDVEPLIRSNRKAFNDAPKMPGRNEGFRKVASIPATVIEEVCRIRKIPFGELMDRKTDRARDIWNDLLNNPNFRKFRTHPGRV